MRRLLLGGVAAALLLGGAQAQTVPGGYSPERLMPEGGQAVQSDLNLRGEGNDEAVGGSGFLRTPLWQEEGWYLMLQGEALVGSDLDGGGTHWGGNAGLILRQALGPADAWGLNAFVDLGRFDGFAGQGSLGLEYEHLGARGTSYRAGANAYLPFEDYSQDRDRSRAPRLGGDLYLGIGQDHGWHRLEGFLTGFHYAETDEVHGLWGVAGEVEYRYSGLDFLPTGSHLYASLGARWDTLDRELAPLLGIGITVAFWNDAKHERVAEVRRNLAYGSAFVPLDRKSRTPGGTQLVDLGCGPGNSPFADQISTPAIFIDNGVPPPGENFPNGTPIGQIVGQAAVDAVCNGYLDCLAAFDAPDSGGQPIFELQTVTGFKAADSCAWTALVSGGG